MGLVCCNDRCPTLHCMCSSKRTTALTSTRMIEGPRVHPPQSHVCTVTDPCSAICTMRNHLVHLTSPHHTNGGGTRVSLNPVLCTVGRCRRVKQSPAPPRVLHTLYLSMNAMVQCCTVPVLYTVLWRFTLECRVIRHLRLCRAQVGAMYLANLDANTTCDKIPKCRLAARNALQRTLIEGSAHGIPISFVSESLHSPMYQATRTPPSPCTKAVAAVRCPSCSMQARGFFLRGGWAAVAAVAVAWI